MRTSKSKDIAARLEAYAERLGIIPLQPYNIIGFFSLGRGSAARFAINGENLWCRPCAYRSLSMINRDLPESEREHNFEREAEEKPRNILECRSCNARLKVKLSREGVLETLSAYLDPSFDSDFTPSVCLDIACVLRSTPNNKKALALGEAAINSVKAQGHRI